MSSVNKNWTLEWSIFSKTQLTTFFMYFSLLNTIWWWTWFDGEKAIKSFFYCVVWFQQIQSIGTGMEWLFQWCQDHQNNYRILFDTEIIQVPKIGQSTLAIWTIHHILRNHMILRTIRFPFSDTVGKILFLSISLSPSFTLSLIKWKYIKSAKIVRARRRTTKRVGKKHKTKFYLIILTKK